MTEQDQREPRDDQPGGVSTPRSTSGEGPVGLEDRTATDQKGSPDTNQGRTEPIPSTPGHRDPQAPLEPPLLSDMNVGAADPQRPSLPYASSASTTGAEPTPGAGPGNAPQDLSGPGQPPAAVRPERLSGGTTGTDSGPASASVDTPGVAHRAPGFQGTPSPAERVETDVQDSAAAMVRDTGRPSGAGDTHGVEVPSGVESPGTSEEHGVVQGARIPTEQRESTAVDEPGSSTP